MSTSSTSVQIPEGFRLAADGRLWLPGSMFFDHAWEAALQWKSRFEQIENIVAVSRGALSAGSVFGNAYGRNDLKIVHAQSYTGEDQGEVSISGLDWECMRNRGADTVVIDDLFHTGKTVRSLKKQLPEAIFVAVYARPQGMEVGEFFFELPDEPWIVFPWEEPWKNFVPAVAA